MKAEYISHMGDDLTVVNAARVSFAKESAELEGRDEKLISYLSKHGHWSPFSHPQITLRYTVPIFVARQEFKHIVGFTRNEESRRYIDDDPEFFVPNYWRKRPVNGAKQGSLDESIANNNFYRTQYNSYIKLAQEVYEDMIEDGVAPEQARMVLPQSMYTSYYVTGSLAAFARFYKQRSDPHAQKEIQDLAEMVQDIIEPLYPHSWEALTK